MTMTEQCRRTGFWMSASSGSKDALVDFRSRKKRKKKKPVQFGWWNHKNERQIQIQEGSPWISENKGTKTDRYIPWTLQLNSDSIFFHLLLACYRRALCMFRSSTARAWCLCNITRATTCATRLKSSAVTELKEWCGASGWGMVMLCTGGMCQWPHQHE